MLFRLSEGLYVAHELVKKIAKNKQKIAFFGTKNDCAFPYTPWKAENGHFLLIFRDFLHEFVCNVQTFIESKQHPQAGPETSPIISVKFENFWKNQFFGFFWRRFPSGAATQSRGVAS